MAKSEKEKTVEQAEEIIRRAREDRAKKRND